MNRTERLLRSGNNGRPRRVARGCVCVLVPLLLAMQVLLEGCGGSSASPSAGSPGSSPTGSVQPPFNTGKGEGNLLDEQVVVMYPTHNPGGSNRSDTTYLDTYYGLTICPSTLSTAYCAQDKTNLNTAQFGNFNLSQDPIGNNPLGVAMIDAIKIQYTAVNVDQSAVTVSGGILIPHLAPASIKGLILYFHGTTVDRANVPSNFVTPSNSTGDSEGKLLAALWASQGYVVIMPDYIGLGDDTTHAHPYVVYPAQNAQSGLAMIKAARSFLATSYGMTALLPLFTTGYSEGGAYSLEAAQLMQDNSGYASQLNVSLRKAVPLSGAFDLSGTMLSYLFDNISTTNNNWYSLNPAESASSKPFLSGDLALGFATYSGIPAADILSNTFYNCGEYYGIQVCTGNLGDVYYSDSASDTTVTLVALTQAELTGWGIYTDNAITPLLTQAYADALMQKDTNNPLYQQLVAGDTYPFVPAVPVTLVSLSQDSVVTRKNSDVAFAYFTQHNPQGPYAEQLIDNSGFYVHYVTDVQVDHLTELPFASVLMLNEFDLAK